MTKLSVSIGLSAGLTGLALGLAGCSSNPLGEPIWSNWDTGAKPVTAYEAEGASTPTGAIPPQSDYTPSYGSATPVRNDGRAPQGQVESAPLSPPPGSSASPPGSGPRADVPPASLPPDPYQSHSIQRTQPLAVTGLGSVATPPGPQKTVTQRTLPLVIAGKGIDRGTASE